MKKVLIVCFCLISTMLNAQMIWYNVEEVELLGAWEKMEKPVKWVFYNTGSYTEVSLNMGLVTLRHYHVVETVEKKADDITYSLRDPKTQEMAIFKIVFKTETEANLYCITSAGMTYEAKATYQVFTKKDVEDLFGPIYD